MVDYTYYTTKFHGAVIPETAFLLLEMKAVQYIRQYTFRNLDENKEIPTAVKNCVCDVATLLYSAEQNDNAGVISEKDGQWQMNYESSEQSSKNLKGKIVESIKLWLADTGLLYSGV